MNLIACGENCRHQQEGYCALNGITHLTSNLNAKCGYYEARKETGNAIQTEQNQKQLLSE